MFKKHAELSRFEWALLMFFSVFAGVILFQYWNNVMIRVVSIGGLVLILITTLISWGMEFYKRKFGIKEIVIAIDKTLNSTPHGEHDFRGRVINKGDTIKNAHVELRGLEDNGVQNREFTWENGIIGKIDIHRGEKIFDIASTSGFPHHLLFTGTKNHRPFGGESLKLGTYSFQVLLFSDSLEDGVISHDVKIKVRDGDATNRVLVLEG